MKPTTYSRAFIGHAWLWS